MKLLTALPKFIPEFRDLLAAIDSGRCPAALSGLSPVHRAHFAAAAATELDRPLVMVCADEEEAQRLCGDLTAFLGVPSQLLTAREFAFYDAAAASHQWEHRRLAVFRAMTAGEAPVVVATIEALLQRTLPPPLLDSVTFTLSMEVPCDLNDLTDALSRAGYSRTEQVEGVGQFALRGGILDFFSPAYDHPVRVEFWGDTIDSMGLFSVTTQRRVESLTCATILPPCEVLPALSPDPDCLGGDRNLPQIYPQLASAADYLPPDALVFFSESSRVAERARTYLWQLEEDVKILLEKELIVGKNAVYARTYEELTALLEDFPVCYLDSFTVSGYAAPPRTLLSVMAKQLPSYGASLETAVSDLAHYQKEGYGAVVLVSSEQRALNLQSLLRDQKIKAAVDFALHDLPKPGDAVIAVGGLSAGFEYPAAKLAVLTEGAAPTGKKKQPKKPTTNRQKLNSYADLSPGDLVVHEHHGVGRFLEMTKMSVDGLEKDYVKIAYAGADVLYVPATQLDLVSKYIGGGDDAGAKRLSKLGGTDWARAKSKARAAVADLAKGLVQLYAQRQRLPGFAFSPDSPWQREFEDQFEYTETDDQLRSVVEIKRDMERPQPMDRLLCGDVGYGKTEVAFRAIMKCILDGKQA
ncbi:MAG: CarD family transcriptional regulator, partial [Oscillospiraceae bacterium]